MDYIITSATALIAGLALTGTSMVHAATITTNLDKGFISLVGEMSSADVDTFRRVAAPMPPRTIVVLNSPGGVAMAGTGIGDLIRQKRFMTYVAGDTYCASACAMAWLGGVGRFVSTKGRVGFHGVYDAATNQQSGPGNALVGAYLNRLGLSDAAIVYITSKPHDEIQWLTAQDATALGIDAFVAACQTDDCLLTSTTPGRAEAIPTPRTPSSVEKVVADSLRNFFAAWSSTGTGDRDDQQRQAYFLAELESVYTDPVNYYGKVFSKAQVVADKQAFARRWPRRDYRIRPGTLLITCNGNLCDVTGVMDWSTASATRATSGAASFQYNIEIVPSDGSIIIAGETSQVIARQPQSNLNSSSILAR